MENISFKYGQTTIDVSIPKKNCLGTIESAVIDEELTEEEVILRALNNPIESPKIRDIVKPGQRICIVISDITRSWQRMSIYLPYIVEELEKSGIKDEDIIFLSATGSHRRQTEEEHRVLLGEKLFKRFQVIDHVSQDRDSLVNVGTTSFGTPVMINKEAINCDHLIITGAIVFHDLAGWGGGKKSILPGICGYESIMANHALSLSKEIGKGTHPMVQSGNIYQNPLHEDMVEAANMVKPSFLFNVIINDKGEIGKAVAGHYLKAHDVGQRLVDDIDGVTINEKADMVIVSAGGYPKDIDLYQASKAISNAKGALKEKGIMILATECIEGIGNPDMEEMINDFSNNKERELSLRENFTVSRYIGYLMAELGEKFEIILVSDIKQSLVENIGIKVFKTMEKALEHTYKEYGKSLTAYLIPRGANTLPKLK